MIKEFTCIICPRGCELEAVAEDGRLLSVSGAGCKRGEAYVRQELTDPQRNIATSVLVVNGRMPLTSVRLSRAVSKDRIFPVMAEIKKMVLKAPVHIGDIVIADVLGTGSDVIATKTVEAEVIDSAQK